MTLKLSVLSFNTLEFNTPAIGPTQIHFPNFNLPTRPSNPQTSTNSLPTSTNASDFYSAQNNSPLEHPMHLHGHDFLVLGASGRNVGPFTAADKSRLKWQNPPRRDTTMVAANGWLVIAFKTDNPGAWLMHCHIAWHVSGGLGVDFIERLPEQAGQITTQQRDTFEDECDAWRTFSIANNIEQPDSGLRRPQGSGTVSGV
jgi:hypothetical protein